MPPSVLTLPAAAARAKTHREGLRGENALQRPTSHRFVGPRVGLYRTIIIDPPWPERGSGKIKRGADRHYKLMSIPQIAALPIEQLADPSGAHLYLCATNNYLKAAFFVLDAWGFEFITNRTWVKADVEEDGRFILQPAGLGQYFRGETEQVLFARCGPVLPYKLRADGKRAQAGTAIVAPRGEHSAKPDQLFIDAQLVSYAPGISVFERKARPGFDSFGDQSAGDVRLESRSPRAEATAAPNGGQLVLGGVHA